MITGTKAFAGKGQATLISAIMSAAPRPMREIVTTTPPALERIVQRCLEKDPENRWQNARDLLLELASVQRDVVPDAVSSRSRPWVSVALSGVVVLALVGGAFYLLGLVAGGERPAWSTAPIRFTISPPADTTFYNGDLSIPFAVSPDGRQIAFIATSPEGTRQIWVRSLDSDAARPVSGTEGASSPFWSPDNEWIGFSTGSSLRKVRAAGGASQVLGPWSNPFRLGATWNSDDIIVFQAAALSGLARVSAQGGNPSAVTSLDPARPEAFHSWPQFLEDGRSFVYSQTNPGQIYLGSLDGTPPRLLMDLRNLSALGYTPGYILYVEDTVLYARPFDDDRREFSGEPLRIVDGIPVSGPGRAPFSVSANGVLAYSPNAIGDVAALQWFERDGRPGAVAAPPANYSGFSIAPDGRRLVLSRWDASGGRDIWLRDLSRGGESRLTSDGDSMMPLWAPQGNRLAFATGRVRAPDLHMIDLDSSTRDRELTTSSDVEIPQSLSTDGKTILYHRQGAKGSDLWVLNLEDGKTEPLAVNTSFNEWQGRLSPDGRWIAYVSDETGRNDVFVAGFPSGRGKRAVSTGGGVFPQWRGDGRELFYVSDSHQLMAVSVNATQSTIDVGAPAELFRINRAVDLAGRVEAVLYNADPAGQRFLVAVRAPASSAPPIQVIVNWTALLQQR